MIIGLDTCFKWLNFLVLLVGLLYVMRRHGIIKIISLMRIEQQKKDDLDVLHKEVLDKSTMSKIAIREQERSYVVMQQNFALWAQKVQEEQVKEQADYQAYQKKVAQRHQQKIDMIQRQAIMHKQLPQLLDEVAASLQVDFAKNHNAHQGYIEQLLIFVKEKDL